MRHHCVDDRKLREDVRRYFQFVGNEHPQIVCPAVMPLLLALAETLAA